MLLICEYFSGFTLKYLSRSCSKKLTHLHGDFELWSTWVTDARNKDNLRELMLQFVTYFDCCFLWVHGEYFYLQTHL